MATESEVDRVRRELVFEPLEAQDVESREGRDDERLAAGWPGVSPKVRQRAEAVDRVETEAGLCGLALVVGARRGSGLLRIRVDEVAAERLDELAALVKGMGAKQTRLADARGDDAISPVPNGHRVISRSRVWPRSLYRLRVAARARKA